MRRLPDSLDASTAAFRELTGAPAEGSATRARVLARAERDARRRGLLRRSVAAFVVVVASLLSGVALTAAGYRWRAPLPTEIRFSDGETRLPAVEHSASAARIVPLRPAESTPLPSPDSVDREALAYERAHHAHFFAEAPARALAAWDAYLAAYPHGTFAPEARYNRVLCLARLGRYAAAATALRPFAAGPARSYRKQDACTLLRGLSERDARVDPRPSCPDGG
jgi:hypothetical protein